MNRHHAFVGLSLSALLVFHAAPTPIDARLRTRPATPLRPRCLCVRTASVATVARSATFLAIGTADTMLWRELPSGEAVGVYRVRVERAWRWPGHESAPPKYVDVYSKGLTSCSGNVGSDEPYVVQASHAMLPDRADSVLSLAGRCSLEGPATVTGSFGEWLRKERGEEHFRRWARDRAAEVDSISQALGPGTRPTP